MSLPDDGRQLERERTARWTTAGAVLFFLVAPGTVAGVVPRAITHWRVEGPFLGLPATRILGGLLVAIGLASLLESFARFPPGTEDQFVGAAAAVSCAARGFLKGCSKDR